MYIKKALILLLKTIGILILMFFGFILYITIFDYRPDDIEELEINKTENNIATIDRTIT